MINVFDSLEIIAINFQFSLSRGDPALARLQRRHQP
jgi:hypothetical protein